MFLEIPLRKSNFEKKSIPFMGLPILNKLSNDLRTLPLHLLIIIKS